MSDEPLWDVEPEEHAAQLDALLELTEPGSTVLDLGAGAGRVAIPLAEAGRLVIAVDRDEESLARLADHAPAVRTRVADLLDDSEPLTPAGVDAIDACVCLGNTFALIHEPARAVRLLRRVRALLARGGVFAIDDFPLGGWAELIEGNWQAGLNEDASMQFVWSHRENVFAIREGDAVAPESWQIGPADTPMRLWMLGELELLGMLSGFAPPEASADSALVLMRAVPFDG